MDIVAGPQGSGKSTFFRVAERGLDSFNVDERRRELNAGHAFIEDQIRNGKSFSFEATLAKEVTFEQASQAKSRGFEVLLTYVATDLEECVERVPARGAWRRWRGMPGSPGRVSTRRSPATVAPDSTRS